MSKEIIQFENAYFYDENGAFDEEKGKDAIIALMEYHGYPVYPDMRESLWVSDYGTGHYTEVGLAARMWVNHVEHQYMNMDLYLLPNQMIPEHWHLGGVQDGVAVPDKCEGWLVRHGSSYVMGEGEDNMTITVPASHNNGEVTVKHQLLCVEGDYAKLNRPLAHHWQKAGPEGAILNETANCHCDAGVRHLDQGINDNFLGG
jgi:D-lyxose ketol-isomerase